MRLKEGSATLKELLRKPPDPIEFGGLGWQFAYKNNSTYARSEHIVYVVAYAAGPQTILTCDLRVAPTQAELWRLAMKYRAAAARQAQTWSYLVASNDGIPWEIHCIEDDFAYGEALAAFHAA